MDLVLRDATLVDGTGAAPIAGDLGIRDGRIVSIGAVAEKGNEEIDLHGLAVAPGFIDVHTHYDAQALWDPLLSPSVFHGVTTVLAGNCGFTLAPLSDDAADIDYLIRMLSRVEGMPLNALREGVKPDWRSFGQYLDRLDGRIAINAAFLVGHSTLRRTVMGERALSETANAADLERMRQLLRESLSAGGAGFSTTVSATHVDYEGRPVPSRVADREEIIELCRVTGEFPGTWLELVPGVTRFTDREYSLTTEMSLAGNRPVNWNLLSVSGRSRPEMESQLHAGDYARERGALVYALVGTMVPKAIMSLASGFMMDAIPDWSPIIALPHAERRKAILDPQVQARMQAGLDRLTPQSIVYAFKDVPNYLIEAASLPHNQQWIGRTMVEYANAHDKDPFVAFLSLSAEEDLRLAFSTRTHYDDPESWQIRAAAWQDQRCIVGGSDAGAHLDMLNTFAFASEFLNHGVRQRQLVTLEEAVRLMTSVPADRFGLTDRGRLKPGAWADIVVFDPRTVASGPFGMRSDLPCGESRVYSEAVGIPHVIVNGVPVIRNGKPTGAVSGRILRSGRDTHTVVAH